ncbi:MAG: acyltransferase [Candidatus Hydrogenedens sp.]|nr:acyltransferase [Candidatus Hydrogenedentota bacterium]NLF56145.1 acyltransferase [Candidatus Hydrogenedens sp.]
MNSLARMGLTWWHARKFTRLGAHCRFPIPDLHVSGHVETGESCRFRNNVTLRAHPGARIVFGNRSGCSWGCLVEARALVQIGNYTGIAEYTILTDAAPRLMGNLGPWREAPMEPRPVRIGDNCFIGSACFIGPGVTVGEGAVIAHHSVVLRDVGPYEIWGGAPARKMGHRTEGVPESKIRELQEMIARHGLQRDRYLED